MSTRSSSEYSAAPAAEIQPCGFLVALDPQWCIAHVSANIADYFTDGGQPTTGQPLSEFFGAAAVHALRNQLALLRDPQGTVRLFSLVFAGVAKPFDIAMHRMDDAILLEALPAAHDAGDPIGTVRGLAARLDRRADLGDLVREGARQLRALTGYERVTIYRFAGDKQAERMAHEARGDHPPPTPPVDREGLRMIGDIEADPVALDPPLSDGVLRDGLLRHCLLRFPSGREGAEAKANGAAASLTLPLRSGGRDWGVALCLNSGPRQPILARIAAAELLADLLAMRAELCVLRG